MTTDTIPDPLTAATNAAMMLHTKDGYQMPRIDTDELRAMVAAAIRAYLEHLRAELS